MIPKKQMLETVEADLGRFTATERCLANAIIDSVKTQIISEFIRIAFVRNESGFKSLVERAKFTADLSKEISAFVATVKKDMEG